jgi:tRNA-dependent cyclodipeptide synthase
MLNNHGIRLRGFLLKCPEIEKQKFADSHVVLLVSVGKPYHEGEKLQAAINFVNNKFKTCTIMVCDSLQRHTLSLTEQINIDKAYTLSLQTGERWIYESSKIYQALRIPYSLYRWDQWLKAQEYEAAKNTVDKLYTNDIQFKTAIDTSANKFISRYARRHPHPNQIDYHRAYAAGTEYLKEECCVIMNIWRQYDYDFILYPGEMIDAVKMARHHFVLQRNSEKLKWLYIKFRRNNKTKAEF